jgi:predicted site-specific integrase-resolvase
MKQPQTRQEKLAIIKNILQGKASLHDLVPQRAYVWLNKGAIFCTYIDGQKIELSENEYRSFLKTKGRNSHHIILKRTESVKQTA